MTEGGFTAWSDLGSDGTVRLITDNGVRDLFTIAAGVVAFTIETSALIAAFSVANWWLNLPK